MDVANPFSPQLRAQIRDGLGAFTNLAGVAGVAWAGSNFVVAAFADSAVTIVSATNPTNLVRLAELRDGVGGWNELFGAAAVAVGSKAASCPSTAQ